MKKKINIKIILLIILLMIICLVAGIFIGKKIYGNKEEKNTNNTEEKEKTTKSNIMSEESALALGNELWEYTYNIYWKGTCDTTYEEVKKHFTEDVSITAAPPMNSYTLSDFIGENKSYCNGAGRGAAQDYKLTTLKTDVIEENKISFIATSEFCGGSFCHDTQETVKTVEKPFVIKKIDGQWLIQSFYLPN